VDEPGGAKLLFLSPQVHPGEPVEEREHTEGILALDLTRKTKAAFSGSDRFPGKIDDLICNGESGRRSRAWSVQDVQRAWLADEMEVLYQFASGGERLCANAGAPWGKILYADVRHKALERTAEDVFAEGLEEFGPAHGRVL
jgi:hypothetical protein